MESSPTAGDCPALVYSRCRAALRPALAGRLGCPAAAEDVLHDAFVRFLDTYGGRPVGNPLALVARIAINIVRDIARSDGVRRRQMETRSEPVCAAPPPADPETICSDRQWLMRVADSIQDLPPRCREVFLLHRVEGLPQAEVASVLGISVSAVEKHMVRAGAHLRRALAVDSPLDGAA